MKLINADKVIEKLKEHKSLFCKNRDEFRALSDKDKARVDEIDTCIAELVNAEEVPHAQLGTNLAEVGTDAISREQAIKATWQDTGYTDPFNVMTAIRDRIQQLPPIQPNLLQPWEVLAVQAVLSQPAQPKRGKWIRTGSGSLYDHYECSECGKAPKWECMGDNRWKIAFTDFCPNCGAKMEVNHESN